MFDALHQKNEFDHSLNYVSERIVLRAIQHKRLQKLNINQDSNVSFDDIDEKMMTTKVKDEENDLGLKMEINEKGDLEIKKGDVKREEKKEGKDIE